MNNISDLRDQLFQTLADLRNKDKPMDIERAKAIGEIAQTIINSAKVEIDYIKATDSTSTSTFIEQTKDTSIKPAASGGITTTKQLNGHTVRTHKMN